RPSDQLSNCGLRKTYRGFDVESWEHRRAARSKHLSASYSAQTSMAHLVLKATKGGDQMPSKIRPLLTALAVTAAVGGGGAAIASAATSSTTTAPSSAATTTTAPSSAATTTSTTSSHTAPAPGRNGSHHCPGM